jgi:hypothetical protein
MTNLKQTLLDIAEVSNALRVMPRLFIGVYIVLLYDSVTWFMTLSEPTLPQAGLISVMTGVGASWFSSYVNSGGSK